MFHFSVSAVDCCEESGAAGGDLADPLKGVATGDFHQWILDISGVNLKKKIQLVAEQSGGNKHLPNLMLISCLLIGLF